MRERERRGKRRLGSWRWGPRWRLAGEGRVREEFKIFNLCHLFLLTLLDSVMMMLKQAQTL